MRSSHGGDIYRNKVSYDFSVNVNPFGMPKSCKKAILDSLEMASCYPDCDMTELRKRLAEMELGTGAEAGQVIFGNGASELIYAICQYLKPERTLVTAPSFREYEAGAMISGGGILYEPLEAEAGFAVTERILEKISPEVNLLFLCSPNNPTGQVLEKDLLVRAAEKCEATGTFFCLDECFLPFMEGEEDYTLRGELSRFPRLMILKAFTKIFGMAGIRFGYLLSSNQKLLEGIRSVMQPWNVSIPAQAAAAAALKEEEYLFRTKKLISKERQFLLDELAKLGVQVIGAPAANFIFFRAEPELAQRFLEKGVLIRSCNNYAGLGDGYFRIGVRSPEENRALLRIWKELQGR